MGQTVTNYLYGTPDTFSRDELYFTERVPEHLDLECPICLQVMWDPYLVSCCGHHFCGECIEQARKTNPFCPLCKSKDYQTICDKGLQRTIASLSVKCINYSKGCRWEGRLQDLPAHTSRKSREGECTLVTVACKNGCGYVDERWRLSSAHEQLNCPKRMYSCTYCGYYNTHEQVTGPHLSTCKEFPINCPNNCRDSFKLPRRRINAHLRNECPLSDVKCDYEWAGCEWEGFRRDMEIHLDRNCNEHLCLVSKVTISVQEENRKLKKEMDELRKLTRKATTELRVQTCEINSLKSEVRQLKLRMKT